MNKPTGFDFSGWATKVDLKCSDGRVIRRDAFKHNDGKKVPLAWQHLHNDPMNVLGHGILENRPEGVYLYGYFNETEQGKQAKALVEHGDIDALSIFANQLKQKGDDVIHGNIREVSLVYAGANLGARIDNIVIQHSDDSEEEDVTEAIIHTGEVIVHGDIEHSDGGDGASDETLGDIFETLDDKQKTAVYALLAHALDTGDDGEMKQSDDEGGNEMKKSVFDQEREEAGKAKNTLSHAEFGVILEDAKKFGSLKDAILMHAQEYGIENIDILFPDAKMLTANPEWLKREDDWVQGVLSAIRKTPFSRVKSMFADMDIDTARAKGYIKATEKKETYFKMSKRVTTPCTIYVKQKIDRDDMLDITDFDVVAMIRFQLRTLLDEELAMAVMLGDGRDAGDPYKISEENIRPIWTEEDLFCVKETLTSKTDAKKVIKEVALTHKNYKGSGSPIFYTTPDMITNMLWIEDNTGRRIYNSVAEIAAAMRVADVRELAAMEDKSRLVGINTHDLIGIKVNLKDYNLGADKGGQVATFDDFDIDFNQYKYLMETRVSGALTKAKCAQVYEFVTLG